jgi:hypothetical protein
MLCCTLLAVMIGAGFSHFWSVKDMVGRFPTQPAHRIIPAGKTTLPDPGKDLAPDNKKDLASNKLPDSDGAQKEFFQGLLDEIRALRNENRNLTDQVAETNRDMMKMQFRLDTHSASFRPLPVSEDKQRGDVSGFPDDDFPGVLPPRASPVDPLDDPLNE